MAKKKTQERGKVKLGLNDLSNDTYKLIHRLDEIVSSYGSRMSIGDLSEIVDAVKAECGEDAAVAVLPDDYFGNSVEIDWWRPETDEEWAKRLETNKKRAAATREQRATQKKNKEIAERAEFARLQKKYSKET